ncbi:dUTP diphosphatase [Sinorhizobium meliloti]|nr:dUTP diphosphatase [Sinorhizobium meliloti]
MNQNLFSSTLDIEFKLFFEGTPWLKADPDPSKGEFPLPQYESEEAAAMDIRAFMDEDQVVIEPGQSFKFRSGFGFHINNPWIAAHVLPRSGTGVKGTNLKNTLGLIDSDYQGELFCTAINTNPPGTDPIVVNRGDRIFQLVFVPVVRVNPNWVGDFSVASKRGVGGFGSTGKN